MRGWWGRLQRARKEEIGVFGLRLPRRFGYGGREEGESGRAGDDAGGPWLMKLSLQDLERNMEQNVSYDRRILAMALCNI